MVEARSLSREMIILELPWPPSVNHYWRRKGSRYFVSSEGKAYKDSVYYLCTQYRGLFKPCDRLSLFIDAYPPDKRRRDLDNLIKAIQDSLQYAGVYEDDSQIDCLTIKRNTLREIR